METYPTINECLLNSDTILFGILTKIHNPIPYDMLRDYPRKISMIKDLRELINRQLYE